MSDFINTIDALGDDVVVNHLIERTLIEFKDDQVTTIGSYAFQNCSELTTIDMPALTTIEGTYTIANCPKLESVNFPAVISQGRFTFASCSNLKYVNEPLLREMGDFNFRGCASLEKVTFPSLVSCPGCSFMACSKLNLLDFSMLTGSVGGDAFNNTGLKALILRNDTVVPTLENTSAFTKTPIANGTGFIYVPGNLVNSYRTATNWSTYAYQFRGILGDEEGMQGIIDETLVDYENNEIESIPAYSFRHYAPLKSVKSDSVTEIGEHAFLDCANLTTAEFPNATHLGTSVFGHCVNLSEIHLPKLVSMNIYGLNIDAACKITELILPSLLEIPNQGIYFHTTPITKMEFASVTHICSDGIRYCKNTDKIILPSVTLIDSNGINNCDGLKALILSGDTMCTLAAADGLTNTGINTGTGYIYVPRYLIEDYKVAENWSTYASQFRALEDYTVDGTTTGELDESKI